MAGGRIVFPGFHCLAGQDSRGGIYHIHVQNVLGSINLLEGKIRVTRLLLPQGLPRLEMFIGI